MARQSWKVSFREGDSFRDRTRGQPEAAEAESGHPCPRGDWCYGRRITVEDGKTVITPASTPRAYCEKCWAHVVECLGELPGAYRRLEGELGEASRRGEIVHLPPGPRLPLRENIDALMRLMAVTLCGWEARVQAQASLARRDPMKPIHTAGSVGHAVDTLVIQQSVLLALQPKWMTRTFPRTPDMEAEFAEADLVRQGIDHFTVLVEVGAEDAGREILRLHYKALAILGECGQQAETLDGIPCRRCEDMALERAEPPSDPKLPVMWSQCASCRDQMSREDFAAWAAMYAKWADDAGLACKRCQAGRHDECAYRGCSCRGCGHAVAA